VGRHFPGAIPGLLEDDTSGVSNPDITHPGGAQGPYSKLPFINLFLYCDFIKINYFLFFIIFEFGFSLFIQSSLPTPLLTLNLIIETLVNCSPLLVFAGALISI